MTKVREDKMWQEATNLEYLTELFEKSKPTKKDSNGDDQDNDDDDDEENIVRFLFQISITKIFLSVSFW